MDVLKLIKANDIFINLFNTYRDESINNINKENQCVIIIQRLFRGTRSRERIRRYKKAAIEIERLYRGHIGRMKFNKQLQLRNDVRKYYLYQYFTLQIQRSFRGYYSRKYKANHSNRKKFIKQTLLQAESIREKLYNYSVEQAMYEEQKFREDKDEEFRKYASNLNHLLSTKQIRGVFNPNPNYYEVPTMNNAPVEDHIRGVIRDLLRTRGIAKTGLVADMHGSRKIPLKGLKNRLSLQASAPYDIIEQEKKKTRIIHKIYTDGKGSFFAGGKTDIINNNVAPLSTGDTYVDQYANPLLMRGVPKDQKEFNDTAWTKKPLFIRHQDIPFYPRSGGNKSTVLPNDLFDVIGEAEVTGGVAQRHYGKSTRFGVPDNCDNRPIGVLPAPPSRASTLRATKPRIRAFTGGTRANTAPKNLEEMMTSNNFDSSDDES